MTRNGGLTVRLARVDWSGVSRALDDSGWSRLPRLLTAPECQALIACYGRDALFRSTVDMERHRFGRGQYRYLAYPLPPIVATLRQSLYERLHPVANAWARALSGPAYPPTLSEFLERCHGAQQTRPTPLLLRYGPGDYNCLHQDLYGPLAFPLQALVMLSQVGRNFSGGEIVLTEQRPRAQSRATALSLDRGEALIFTNHERPARGARGFYRVQMRHGVSEVTSGSRYVLGIIFHDAV